MRKVKKLAKKQFPFGWLSLVSTILLFITILIVPSFISPLLVTSPPSVAENVLTIWGILIFVFSILGVILGILGIVKNKKAQNVISIICLILSGLVLILLSLFVMVASNSTGW